MKLLFATTSFGCSPNNNLNRTESIRGRTNDGWPIDRSVWQVVVVGGGPWAIRCQRSRSGPQEKCCSVLMSAYYK